MATSVPVSTFPKPMAAVEAISRFEGPAKGMRLKANPVAKMIKNSIIVAIPWCPLSLSRIYQLRAYKCKHFGTSNIASLRIKTVTHPICSEDLDRFKWGDFKYRRDKGA